MLVESPSVAARGSRRGRRVDLFDEVDPALVPIKEHERNLIDADYL
jgi:hypothetical protein